MKVRREWAGCIAMKAHGIGRKGKRGRIRHFLEVLLPLDNTVTVEGSKMQTVHSLERRKQR